MVVLFLHRVNLIRSKCMLNFRLFLKFLAQITPQTVTFGHLSTYTKGLKEVFDLHNRIFSVFTLPGESRSPLFTFVFETSLRSRLNYAVPFRFLASVRPVHGQYVTVILIRNPLLFFCHLPFWLLKGSGGEMKFIVLVFLGCLDIV